MKKILAHVLDRNNKKTMISLVALLIIFAATSIFSLSKPTATNNQINTNTSHFETKYDYKATITPNVLNPDGGTVEVGDTIFKKITSAIPFTLQSSITSEQQVTVKGTHEVELIVKAGDLWEKNFPLEERQSFKQEGTDLSVIRNTYEIDLSHIKSFITQVEEETGISPEQYTMEVVPNLEGTITSNGVDRPIQAQDNLVFNYSYNEIVLASEKVFTSAIPFSKTETITNTFTIFGFELPLGQVRIASTLLSILLLTVFMYVYKDFVKNRETKTVSLAEKINKKYGSRIIPVTQKVNIAKKSLFTLDSFKSIIKIADEKELPIFCYKDQQNGGAVYFIVDGDYLYNYETSKTDSVKSTQEEAGSETSYARS